MRTIATVLGILLLVAGVAVAIIHYVVEGDFTQSYITLGIAAVLLFAGYALLDWGAGVSRRWFGDKEK